MVNPNSTRKRYPRWPHPAAFLSLLLLTVPLSFGDGLWEIGLRTQGSIDFKPGNDLFTGPEAAYSNYDLSGHQLQIKASYLTSRIEQTFHPNILKYDFLLLTPVWHFRRTNFFDPTVQMDLGYARYDVEDPEIFGDLPNDTWVAIFQPGINLNLGKGRYGLQYHVGYSFINPEGQILYPGIFGLNLWTML